MKVMISVDMEGIAGVVTGEQLGPEGFEYERFREFMTQEAVAAVEGAMEGGATDIIVADSHANGQNLLFEKFPSEVEIVRSWPRSLGMLGGLDTTFDAIMMIGYHSSTTNKRGVRAHTFSSARITDMRINGKSVSERVYGLYLAGHFGVPVVLFTGDDVSCDEMKETAPGIVTAVVKYAYGFHSAKTITPDRSAALIRKRALEALQSQTKLSPVKLQGFVNLDVSFKNYRPVEVLEYLEIVERIDSHTIRYVGKDMQAVENFRIFLMEYSFDLSP